MSSFGPKTFLTCPQGIKLAGNERVQACRSLGDAIGKRHFVTAAELLVKDPSLITENLPNEGGEMKAAVNMAIESEMEPLVLFALSHGMQPESPAFGAPGGLLEIAVQRNSTGLVSCALLYRADPNHSNPFTTTSDAKLANCSLLGQAFTLAITDKNTPLKARTRENAMQIVRMLLDAGACAGSARDDDTWIAKICRKRGWTPNHVEITVLFEELLNRAGSPCLKFEYGGKTLIRIAAEAGNLAAVRCLIHAGAQMDQSELGKVLSTEFNREGMTVTVPDRIAELVCLQRQRNLNPIAATPPPPAALNLAPEGLFELQSELRLVGEERDQWRHLLEMAITQGKFVTATKVLARDSSLIAEPTAVRIAIDAGMHALLPMALGQGADVDSPAFGHPRGLLGFAVAQESPSLASYALLYGADPDQRKSATSAGEPLVGTDALSPLHCTIEKACASPWRGPITTLVSIASMMIDASPSNAMLPTESHLLRSLCHTKWNGSPDQFDKLFAELIKRGGTACVDKCGSLGKPLVRLAAEKLNIAAMKQLIAAGADTSSEFLGGDLFAILKESGGARHIPMLSKLLMQRQIAQKEQGSLASSVTVVTGQDDPDATKPRSQQLTASHVF